MYKGVCTPYKGGDKDIGDTSLAMERVTGDLGSPPTVGSHSIYVLDLVLTCVMPRLKSLQTGDLQSWAN